MTTKKKTAVHKCRDCQTTSLAPKTILCAHCKAAAVEKRKARKRETARERYRTQPKLIKASIPWPPRPCATAGCDTMLEGHALYCASCRRFRRLRHQKNFRENVKPMDEDTPPEPPTSLAWLDNFHDWAISGLSYAAYQKQEWSAKKNAACAIHQ